jgi:hypothetical protein
MFSRKPPTEKLFLLKFSSSLDHEISDARPGLAKIFVTDPLIKRIGDRTDLKGAAVYLLSDASAYMQVENY